MLYRCCQADGPEFLRLYSPPDCGHAPDTLSPRPSVLPVHSPYLSPSTPIHSGILPVQPEWWSLTVSRCFIGVLAKVPPGSLSAYVTHCSRLSLLVKPLLRILCLERIEHPSPAGVLTAHHFKLRIGYPGLAMAHRTIRQTNAIDATVDTATVRAEGYHPLATSMATGDRSGHNNPPCRCHLAGLTDRNGSVHCLGQ